MNINITKKNIFILVLIFIIICSIPFIIQIVKPKKKNKQTNQLFNSDSLLNICLLFDNDVFVSNNEGKRYYHFATISYSDFQNKVKSRTVKIKLHGQFRTDTNYCNMPQLKISFDKDLKYNDLFDNINNVYLIFPCQKNILEYEQYLVQEYLLYKMYNILTDNSFKVRLVSLKLINIGEKKDTIQTYAFFRETEEDLAKRLNAKLLKTLPVEIDKVNDLLMDKISIFQYIIGNDDWSLEAMHNIKIIKKADNILYPIPYDFDFCGLISTPYTDYDSLDFYNNIEINYFSNKNIIDYLTDFYDNKKDSCLLLFEKNNELLIKNKLKSVNFLKNNFKNLKKLE